MRQRPALRPSSRAPAEGSPYTGVKLCVPLYGDPSAGARDDGRRARSLALRAEWLQNHNLSGLFHSMLNLPILFLFSKGLLIGLAIAAPVGPIGVLCIQRSLQTGFKIGLMTGMGAAVADGVYGLIAGFGLTAISSWLL